MRRNQRFEEYGFRRQRATQRRRGGTLPPRPKGCAGRHWIKPNRGPTDERGEDPPGLGVLLHFAERLCHYAGVVAVLSRRACGVQEILAVAPAPWTEAVRALTRTWSESLRGALGPTLPRLKVEPAPPLNLSEYHCLFWRGPGHTNQT